VTGRVWRACPTQPAGCRNRKAGRARGV